MWALDKGDSWGRDSGSVGVPVKGMSPLLSPRTGWPWEGQSLPTGKIFKTSKQHKIQKITTTIHITQMANTCCRVPSGLRLCEIWIRVFCNYWLLPNPVFSLCSSQVFDLEEASCTDNSFSTPAAREPNFQHLCSNPDSSVLPVKAHAHQWAVASDLLMPTPEYVHCACDSNSQFQSCISYSDKVGVWKEWFA